LEIAVLDTIAYLLNGVHPMRAALWLAAAFGLAALLVYACQRFHRARS
jgi:hypothetical protein